MYLEANFLAYSGTYVALHLSTGRAPNRFCPLETHLIGPFRGQVSSYEQGLLQEAVAHDKQFRFSALMKTTAALQDQGLHGP